MASIIKLMAELKYPTNEGGVCLGLAYMAERARRSGQHDKFKERLFFLKRLKENELESLIANAKQHDYSLRLNLTTEPLTKDEEILLTIEAFFFQVAAHFEPAGIQKFLNLKERYLSQDNAYKIEALMYDVGSNNKEISSLSAPKNYFISNTDSLNKTLPLQNFLEKIKNASEKEQLSLGIIVNSGNHTVHVFYDEVKKAWTMTDHSIIVDCKSIEEISQELIQTFSDNDVYHLAVNVFTDEPLEKTKDLWQELDIISQHSLQATIESNTINAPDSYGQTALFIATVNGNVNLVKTLVAHKDIAVNQADNTGAVPLAAAAQTGNTDIATLLLNHPEIAVNHQNNMKISSLTAATAFGNPEIVTALLKHPDIDIPDYNNPIQIAIENGQLDMIEIFQKSNINAYNLNKCFPLVIALQKDQIDIANLLMEHPNIDVNRQASSGETPLILAIEKGQLDFAMALLKHPKIDVNLVNDRICKSALKSAVSKNCLDIVKKLLQFDELDVNYTGHFNPVSALTLACREGKEDIVKELLKHPKIDILKKDEDGLTPIEIALQAGHTGIMLELTKKLEAMGNSTTSEYQGDDSDPTAKNYFQMESIIHFIKNTSVKLKDMGKESLSDEFDFFLSDLEQDMQFCDVMDPNISLAHLKNLVELVGAGSGKNNFFSDPATEEISMAYKKAMAEVWRRNAIVAEGPQAGHSQERPN